MVESVSYNLISNSDVSLNPINIDPNSDYDSLIKSQIFGASTGRCLTCSSYETHCNGHWGKVQLNVPIIKPAFIKFIEELCSGLCIHCGLKILITPEINKILVSPGSKEYSKTVRYLREVVETHRHDKCSNCGSHSLKISYNKEYGGFYSNKLPINNTYIYLMFKMIPYHLYPILSPYKIILDDLFWYPFFPIPPIFIRQDLAMFKGKIFNSMLTHNHVNFVSKISSFMPQLLQKIACEIEKSDEEAPFSNFCQVVTGKSNIIRGMINGVRRDGVTRVVYNFNKSSLLNSAVMSKEYYETMLEAIYVNKFTLKLIQDYHSKSKLVSYYNRASNRLYNIKNSKKIALVLNAGDYVDVPCGIDLSNKPIVIFRYPCLHKYSLMAAMLYPPHGNCRSHTTSSFGSTGMAADQDGDEIQTVHPKDPRSKYEILEQINPNHGLISNVSGAIAYGMIQTEIITFKRLFYETISASTLSYSALKLKMEPRKQYKFNQIIDLIVQDVLKSVPNSEPAKSFNYMFGSSNKHEVCYAGTSNTVFKNIMDFKSKFSSVQFFRKVAYLCKFMLDKFGLDFMYGQMVPEYEFFKSCRTDMKQRLNNAESKYNLMDSSDYMKALSTLQSTSCKEFESRYMKYISDKDPLKHYYILGSMAGVKISSTTLINYFVNFRPTHLRDPISDYYLGRYLPIFKYMSKDIRNFGIHTRCLASGLDLIGVFNTAWYAQTNTVLQAVGTAYQGALARHLHKNMEDIVIDNFRFVTYHRMILDTTINIHKLPNDKLYINSILQDDLTSLSDSLSKYDTRCLELYKRVNRFYMSYDRSRLTSKFLFPLDLDFLMRQDLGKPITDDLKLSRLEQFVKLIHHKYLFGFGSLDNLMFMYLYFFRRLRLSERILNYVLSIIETKYKRSPSPGTPIGLLASTAIGEDITQNNISNFQLTSKSGDVINQTSTADNINYMYLKRYVTKGIYSFMTPNTDRQYLMKLIKLKGGLEYITLQMLGLKTQQTGFDTVKLEFDPELCKKHGVSHYIIESIIDRHLAAISLVSSAEITSSDIYKLIIKVKLSCSMSCFLMMLPMLSKGLTGNKIQLENSHRYLEGKSIDTYKLYIMSFTGSIPFIDYDTRELLVDIPIEDYENLAGRSSLFNKLKNVYNLSGDMFPNHFRVLSRFQLRTPTSLRFRKTQDGQVSTISKLAYERQYNDVQDAALMRRIESTRDIESSMFFNQVLPIGTGWYKSYINIGNYLFNDSSEPTTQDISQEQLDLLK